MKTLPHITTKQQELIRLLYRHRLLNRKQVQLFMHHTDKRRISSWLKDLREKQYIEWTYQADDPVESTKPAIYYLGLNAIRYLNGLGDYSTEELRKRYTERSRKRAFVDRCLLLADCCLNMDVRNADSTNVEYTYSLETDYAGSDDKYYFLTESEFIHPHLCYTKTEDSEGDTIETAYLVEIFDVTTPRYMMKKKLKDYAAFLESNEWEQGTDRYELPIIHIVCPTKAALIHAKRYIGKLLEDTGEADSEDICVRFAIIEQVKVYGVLGRIWEDI